MSRAGLEPAVPNDQRHLRSSILAACYIFSVSGHLERQQLASGQVPPEVATKARGETLSTEMHLR